MWHYVCLSCSLRGIFYKSIVLVVSLLILVKHLDGASTATARALVDINKI